MKSEYFEDVEQRWDYGSMEIGSCENFVVKREELVYDDVNNHISETANPLGAFALVCRWVS